MTLLTETTGWYQLLLIGELFLLLLMSGLAVVRGGRPLIGLLLVFALAGALVANVGFSPGRVLLTLSPLPPGSWLTRFWTPNIAPWLRLYLEPALWLLLLALAALGHSAARPAGRYLSFSALALLLMIFLESFSLTGLSYQLLLPSASGRFFFTILHFLLVQGFLLCSIIGFLQFPKGNSPAVSSFTRKILPRIFAAAAVLLLLSAAANTRTAKPIAGAHYYSWFPENWGAGYLGEKLQPELPPLLGEYNSDDPKVFNEHLRWAKLYGIDFFILDWWPKRMAVDRRLKENLARETDFGSLQFCLLYETLDLPEPGDAVPASEKGGSVYLTPERIERLSKHLEYLAKTFMHDPRYLRINGRPVLFLYTTRHLLGPVKEAFETVRRHVKEKTGISLYLVGDEVYFNVLTELADGSTGLLPEFQANWQRMLSFDALAIYNPYDAARTQYAGTQGHAAWLSEVATLYRKYRGYASAAAMPFFPTVLPGYNDRGVRLEKDHYIIPRNTHSGKKRSAVFEPGEQTTLFSIALERHIRPFLDDGLPLFTVTSFNEWNEGTQIEPTVYSPSIVRDQSASGQDYLQGEAIEGYEFRYLLQLKNFLQQHSKAEPNSQVQNN